ncbi:uncharacterized protein DUF4037 [Pseudonocardia hierapolitana]|uniref:Uncharacterized protein DUF4037 n=1 Tax=Pseudonocardia hierapolitana TaxID=1128676 RepID=A0A561T2W7_9PSEU|nr:DUF4037 domain-containing protein [Pseudonocardia hierapolitana]TWF81457.1 uncharacterized protein DUF4037 [Pseudonocardia hierapolitana]
MFVAGLQLSRAFYAEAVQPLLEEVPHSAARIGPGSEVLGFDTPRSADHEWGPRLEVFLSPADAGRIPELHRRLAEHLPRTFHGWPTHFEPVEGDHAGRMTPTDGPVRHRVGLTTVEEWCQERLGVDPRRGLSSGDWLATPAQALAEATAGAVFHDGLGELEPLRAVLAWYPPDVWRYVLACQWRRIAQEEAFVGRTGEVGDELGSAVVAARLVRDLMRLALLLHRRYPPYSKWLGSAFAALPVASALDPALRGALAATTWHERERHLVTAYETLAAAQNDTGLAAPVDPTTRPYFSRPFQVLKADRFADALLAAVTDPVIAALPRVGAVDQHADNTDLLTDPRRSRAVAHTALSPELSAKHVHDT